MRIVCLSLLVAAFAGPALAQGQPPIQSPQDAACRDEAQARVMGAPNPQGLSLYDLGAQIYRACMQRAQAGAKRKRG